MSIRNAGVVAGISLLLAGVPPGLGADGAPVPARGGWSDVDSLLEARPLAPGESLRVTRIGEGEHSTAVCIQLGPGAAVPGHHHAEHDETVVLWRGTATLRVGALVGQVSPGHVVTIPRGTPHGAVAGPQGCTVISVYAPVWDAADRHRDQRGDP